MKRDPYMKRGLLSLMCSALFFLLATALLWFARRNPAWVTEKYKPVSRALVRILGAAFSWFPFSAAEILLVILFVLSVTLIIRCVAGVLIKKLPRASIFALLSCVTLTASVFYFIFVCVWGLNYHALPLPEEWGLSREPRSVEVLFLTAEELRDEANKLAPLVMRTESGAMSDISFSSLREMSVDGWELLAGEKGYGVSPVKPKAVFFSEAMSYMGITGIFIPFTGEANVNRFADVSGIPFTMCHEMAHSAGIAPEDEANFAAILACKMSPHPEFRYSGALSAFIYCANALAAEDYELYAELFSGLSSEVAADLEARSAYWRKYEGKIQEAASGINDSYLRAMAQPAGVKSYGLVVDLLILDYIARNAE